MAEALTAPHRASPVPDDPDMLYEVVEGQIVKKPPMGAFENWIAKFLYDALNGRVRQQDLGEVFQEMLFDLAPLDRQRCPDVAFVSYERWPKERSIPRTNAWPVVPDLAVEVISPSNTGQEIVVKTGEYFQAGVRLVWIVFPREEQIYVYHSPTRIEVLTRKDELRGEDVIPDFHLPLGDLFEETETEDESTTGLTESGEESATKR